MSYILEALKKSEYTRQQGRVPDLASLPSVAPLPAPALSGARLPMLAGAALLLALAVSGWWRPWQAAPAVANGAAPAAADVAQADVSFAPAPVAASSSAARVAEHAPAQGTPARSAVPATSAPAAALVPAPRPESALALAASTPPPAARSIALPPLPEAAPVSLPAAVPGPAAARPEAALPAPPDRVLSFHELPEAVRARIPPLRVSGFSYAEQADLSLAVINDKVLRQGESVAPGITLERVVGDGVVLGFAGYRFRPQH